MIAIIIRTGLCKSGLIISPNQYMKRQVKKIITGFILLTLHFNFVTVYAQTDEQRKQLSEERQISRMILTIQEQRDIISSHEKENKRLNSLVQNLDRQIANLQRISDEHKTAADERAKAIDLHKQAKAIYKASLDDAKMQISKLEKSVSFWQKVSGVAFIFGLIFGFYAKGS